MKTVIQTIVGAYATVERLSKDHPARSVWAELLDTVCKEYLPSGSGFNAGTQLGDATRRKVTFLTSFHHMNEAGYYDGWTEHIVTVTAEFDGLAIRVSGHNRNEIKDYISEAFHYTLTQPCDYHVGADADRNLSVVLHSADVAMAA